jgi:hypothetical protein
MGDDSRYVFAYALPLSRVPMLNPIFFGGRIQVTHTCGSEDLHPGFTAEAFHLAR